MKISAVIPVRGGSTRVKNKNIRPFCNSSLLEIKIEELKKIETIDEIIVSSDSEEMLDAARQHGVTARKRPAEFCDEKSRTFNEVVRYIASEEVKSGIMMWVPCVCPLIREKRIREGLKLYADQQNGKIPGNGIVTATLIKEYIYSKNGPVNFSVEHHVKSQDLPDWHYIINGFFVAKAEEMRDWGFVYGPDPYLLSVSKTEAIDIDDMYDFEMAEFAYRKYAEEDKAL